MIYILLGLLLARSQINAQTPQEVAKPKNIEIELRYEILDESQLPFFLSPLTFVNQKHIVDIYLDTPEADLLARGIYVRLRNNQRLELKFNRACLEDPTLEIQPYCEEHSFTVPLTPEELPRFNDIVSYLGLEQGQSLEEFKSRNKLIDHRVVDKIRSTYSIEDFAILIDDVKELGKFLEIEIMSDTTRDIDSVTKRMRDILAPLKLKPLKTGFESLILRKHNFQQYLRARFALPEDKLLAQRGTLQSSTANRTEPALPHL
jgi:adenylate cyclase, class 2